MESSRYVPIPVEIWQSPKFRTLNRRAQSVLLAIATTPIADATAGLDDQQLREVARAAHESEQEFLGHVAELRDAGICVEKNGRLAPTWDWLTNHLAPAGEVGR